LNEETAGAGEGAPTLPPASPQPRRRAPQQGSVARNIGLIEPWIGGSLAVYTAWIALVAYSARPALWLSVALAAGLSFWSWRRPARRQGEILGRALCMAIVGCAILFQGRDDDPTGGGGYFFYWLIIPTIFYSFLLKAWFARMLLGANLLAYSLSVLAAATPPDHSVLLVRIGLIVVFSVAAIRMGMQLRRTDELLETRRVDLESGLLNEYGFLDHGTELWRHCRKSGLPIALAFIEAPELRRIKERYGAAAARAALARIAEVLVPLDTGRNVVARLGMLRFAVLVAGTDRGQMGALLAAQFGSPARIEVMEEDLETVMSLVVHTVDSQLQGISFRRFYEAERQALDTLGERAAQPQASLPPGLPVAARTTFFSLPDEQEQSRAEGPDTVPLEIKA
jgi:GGDEF domain-containing protein